MHIQCRQLIGQAIRRPRLPRTFLHWSLTDLVDLALEEVEFDERGRVLDGLVDDLQRARVLAAVVVVLRQVVQQPQLRRRRLSRSCEGDRVRKGPWIGNVYLRRSRQVGLWSLLLPAFKPVSVSVVCIGQANQNWSAEL